MQNVANILFRTAGNVAKMGVFAVCSVFASNLLRMQASSTIKGAETDLKIVQTFIKGYRS